MGHDNNIRLARNKRGEIATELSQTAGKPLAGFGGDAATLVLVPTVAGSLVSVPVVFKSQGELGRPRLAAPVFFD
jgi:hypothetical protein